MQWKFMTWNLFFPVQTSFFQSKDASSMQRKFMTWNLFFPVQKKPSIPKSSLNSSGSVELGRPLMSNLGGFHASISDILFGGLHNMFSCS